MMISIAILMPLASAIAAGAQSGALAAQRAVFAVIADAPGDPSKGWLARGVAFDLEKRLGRLPSLEPADRLDVAAALKHATPGDDASRAHAVADKTGAGIVLQVSASNRHHTLSLRVDLWTGKRRVASFAHNGDLQDLFSLIDNLIDEIVPKIEIGDHESTPSLKWHPCRSTESYEDLITGMLLLQAGETAQAKARLLKSLSAEQDNWFARYFLGAVALREGDTAKAIIYCREAIDLNPDIYSGIYANLSYCYAAMGDSKQAQSAKSEFERRTGKRLPERTVPGAMPSGSFGGRP